MLRLLAAVATLFIIVDSTAISAWAGDASCAPGVVAAKRAQAEQIIILASKIIGNGYTPSFETAAAVESKPNGDCVDIQNKANEILLLASKIIGSG
jgi:hypothetical protein